MKENITVLLFLVSISIFGQQDIIEKISQDVCICFTENKGDDTSILEKCFTKHIDTYKTELDKLIDKNSSVPEYKQGQELGKKIFFEMQQNLVKNCDAYFNYFDNLRAQSILAMKKKYSQSKVQSINVKLSENKTIDLLWERANLYFANNDLIKAEIDYKECLTMNPNHVPSMFFLGWLYERKQNYNKALEIYQSIFDATKKQEIVLFIEVVKRKSK